MKAANRRAKQEAYHGDRLSRLPVEETLVREEVEEEGRHNQVVRSA
jgi:hypothetical protein